MALILFLAAEKRDRTPSSATIALLDVAIAALGNRKATFRRRRVWYETGMAVLCWFLSLAVPLLAREKNEVIIMKNGDRITCEIKGLASDTGFEIAAWNKPADQTGGDYYDWQALPDGRVLVALADVTGHGIGPALLAAVCRAYARVSFGQQNGFLKAMEQVNTAVSADVGEGRFVTFVAAILGPNSSGVELLSAGHAPLFLYLLKHDRFETMEAQGLPLGISPDFFSEPHRTLQFARGDLLLATDGFFEWANAAEELFGNERLENSVRANRDKSPAEIISILYADVLRFAGGTSQKDDLTAMVTKRS